MTFDALQRVLCGRGEKCQTKARQDEIEAKKRRGEKTNVRHGCVRQLRVDCIHESGNLVLANTKHEMLFVAQF